MQTIPGLVAATVAMIAAIWSFQFLTVVRNSPDAPSIIRNSWLDSLVMLWAGVSIPLTVSLMVLLLRELGLEEFTALTVAILASVVAAYVNDAVFSFGRRLRAIEEAAKTKAGAS
jgi:hypothetical protein